MENEMKNGGSLKGHGVESAVQQRVAGKGVLWRGQVLDEMDVRFRPDGRRRIFSIKFVTAEGKLVFFPQAYACGAGRMNNKVYRVRGVQACDCQGNPEPGIHVYPVRIYNIVQYNGHPVQ